MKKIRVAFIKFAGMSVAGSSERVARIWATSLPKDRFAVSFYYCDPAPYLRGNAPSLATEQSCLDFMREHGISPKKIQVRVRDTRVPTFDWIDTNFWEVFQENQYDIAVTVKAGHPEYPFHLLTIPFIEFVTLPAGVDPQSTMSIHCSEYQRSLWVKAGGCLHKSCVIPLLANNFSSLTNYRKLLSIPDSAIVAGFHQRPDDNIFSKIPLDAFAQNTSPERYFVILGGSHKYQEQAKELRLENVRFLPPTGDDRVIAGFLDTLDIFAHGRADGETYGTVLAEAMLRGKPCLSHTVPNGYNAQIETIGPGGFTASTTREYATTLNALYTDASMRQHFGDRARQHAEEYFSPSRCLDALIQCIHNVTTKKTSTSSQGPIPYGLSPLGFLYAGNIPAKDHIAHHVLTQRIPEEFFIRLFRFFLPKMQVFIDVGANTGLYGCVAATEGPQNIHVYCFEPQEDCVRSLKKTIHLNHWESKIHVYQTGVGAQEGSATLYLAGSGSSLSQEWAQSTEGLRINMVSLDTWAQQSSVSIVDFIKIDVEASELPVLKGAESLISSHHPFLLLEIAEGTATSWHSQYVQTLEWLWNHQYAVYRCKERQNLWQHQGTLEKVMTTTPPNSLYMYVCIPKSRESSILPELLQHVKEQNTLMNSARRKRSWIQAKIRSKNFLKRSPLYRWGYFLRNLLYAK